MAKQKIKNIKQNKVSGYGMSNPWDFVPSDADQRAEYTAGAGDYYGTGFRNKTGRVRSGSFDNPLPSSSLKKPPKSLA